MRDPKRIDRIIYLIRDIWRCNPDLRLCQLIENCFTHEQIDEDTGHCIYHKEDVELEQRLRKTYEKT